MKTLRVLLVFSLLFLVLSWAGLVGMDMHYKGKINRMSGKIADIISEKNDEIGVGKSKEDMLDDIILAFFHTNLA